MEKGQQTRQVECSKMKPTESQSNRCDKRVENFEYFLQPPSKTLPKPEDGILPLPHLIPPGFSRLSKHTNEKDVFSQQCNR